MKKYSKGEIGLIQLNTSIELFYHRNFVSALTLGAVAEELFAGLIKLQNEQTGTPTSTAAELDGGIFKLFEDFLGIRDYHAYRNKIKNELKHHGGAQNKDIVRADFEQIARTHISGAIINYRFWKKEMPNDNLVRKFCQTEGLTVN